MKPLLIYVSHPRNGGTELARHIGRMLKDTLGASVYFPGASKRHDDLGPEDLSTLASADVFITVLNREASTHSVPRHVVQLELRKFSARRIKPILFVIRAEPCPIPEPAQGARLALSVGPDLAEDEIVSQIAEVLLGATGATAVLTDDLRKYFEGLQERFGVWATRYTQLSAEMSESDGGRRSLIADPSASAELDALLPDAVATLSVTLRPEWTGTDTYTRRAADVRQVLYAHRRLALIGEPGSGKSTTVRSLVADLAIESLKCERSLPVPVLIRVGGLESPDVERAISEALSPATVADLDGRELWVMLDGLNETSIENAETIIRWINANPQTRLIVTSRRANYQNLRLSLPVAELLPLEVEDIPPFLMRWGLSETDAQSLFWSLAGAEAEQIWKKWAAVGETFENFWNLHHARDSKAFRTTSNFEDEAYDAMRRRMRDEGRLPELLDVVTNPFLLTLTLAIFNRLHQLPKRRAVLFESYVDALLQHFVRANPAADVGLARAAFNTLARAMNDKGLTSVTRSDVATVLNKPQHEADAVLQLGEAASILDCSGDRVRFAHQLLQDHFGAFALATMIARGESPARVWREDREQWWSPTMWDEAAVLLAGLVGHNDEASTALGSPWDVVAWLTPISPTVAWRCIEENRLDVDHPRAQVLRRPTRGTRAAPKARMLVVDFDELLGVGTGVSPDGIPDIAWRDVAAGEFVYGKDSIIDLPDFWMARFPVTNFQFASFTDSGAHLEPKYWIGLPQVGVTSVGAFAGEVNPRDSVNWYEARAFCRWLNELLSVNGEGRIASGKYEVRLPTEHEWEKAARGRNGRAFPWGQDFDPTRCNTLETGLRCTSPVGIFPDGASPYGVEDMAGNVWEWCCDHYSTKNKTILGVVNRGGSCFRDAMRARTTYRADCLPGYHSRGRGFRVVLAPALRSL